MIPVLRKQASLMLTCFACQPVQLGSCVLSPLSRFAHHLAMSNCKRCVCFMFAIANRGGDPLTSRPPVPTANAKQRWRNAHRDCPHPVSATTRLGHCTRSADSCPSTLGRLAWSLTDANRGARPRHFSARQHGMCPSTGGDVVSASVRNGGRLMSHATTSNCADAPRFLFSGGQAGRGSGGFLLLRANGHHR